MYIIRAHGHDFFVISGAQGILLLVHMDFRGLDLVEMMVMTNSK